MPDTNVRMYWNRDDDTIHLIFVNPLMPKYNDKSPQLPAEFGIAFKREQFKVMLESWNKGIKNIENQMEEYEFINGGNQCQNAQS